MDSFNELSLPEFLGHSLKQMNFIKPTEVQAQAIPVALEGKDVIASAQTGTGKTAAFGIPLLKYLEDHKDKTALVLTPTRELAVQVLEVLRKLTGTHNLGGSVLLIGGANMSTQFQQLTRKPRLVIGTPGRIIDHLNRKSLSFATTGFLVLDEADRMLDMGFAPQLDEIRKHLSGTRQTLLFSATFPADIQALGAKYLKEPVRIAVGSTSQPIPKVAQKVLYTTEAKKPDELLGELKERQGSVLIFARTQHRVDRICTRLKDQGVKVTRIHGGRSQSQRRQAIDQFREGKFLVLVATDIAARGLDIHHIAHVINYDLPRNPEDYIHRVGRTARAGAEGESLCFLTPEDSDLWRSIIRLMKVDANSIPVKPSRFGFTGPKPDAKPQPGQRPQHSQPHRGRQNLSSHGRQPHPANQGRQSHPDHGRPHQPHPGRPQDPASQGRPQQPVGQAQGPMGEDEDRQPLTNESRPLPVSNHGHSRHPGQGRRDFQHRDGHRPHRPGGRPGGPSRDRWGGQPDRGQGRHNASNPGRHSRGSRPKDGFIFHGSDQAQPGQYDRGEWKPKQEGNFLQSIARKLMGGGKGQGDHRSSGDRHPSGDRRDFRGDNRRGDHRGPRHGDHRRGDHRSFSRNDRGPGRDFGGHRDPGGEANGNRPHQGPRPEGQGAGGHRRDDHRPGGHRPGGHRPGGHRPGGHRPDGQHRDQRPGGGGHNRHFRMG